MHKLHLHKTNTPRSFSLKMAAQKWNENYFRSGSLPACDFHKNAHKFSILTPIFLNEKTDTYNFNP